jgi:hypothetical protein
VSGKEPKIGRRRDPWKTKRSSLEGKEKVAALLQIEVRMEVMEEEEGVQNLPDRVKERKVKCESRKQNENAIVNTMIDVSNVPFLYNMYCVL